MQYAATAQSNTQLHLTTQQKLLSLTKTLHLTTEHINIPVRYAKSFDTSVYGKDIGNMTIVEPEPGSIHQNSPVVGVSTLEKVLHSLLKVQQELIFFFYNRYVFFSSCNFV